MGRKHDSRMIIEAYRRKEVELVSIEENVAKQSSTAARPSFDFVLLSTRYLSPYRFFSFSYLDSFVRSQSLGALRLLVHLSFLYKRRAQATKIKKKRKAQKYELGTFTARIDVYTHT